MYMHFLTKRIFSFPKSTKDIRLGIQFTIKNKKHVPISERWESRDFNLKNKTY